jgi:hypothetical protein
VDGNDPVGHLADAAEVLPLDAGRLGALLERTGLVEDADGPDGVGRPVGDRGEQFALDGVREAIVIPQTGLEELLQVAWRDAGVQSQGSAVLRGKSVNRPRV